MKGICYTNTLTKFIRGIPKDIHLTEVLGYAYETSTCFVHFYGHTTYFCSLLVGNTVVAAKNGTLNDWVMEWFGAKDIRPMDLEVGYAIEGIWRPSLYHIDEVFQALRCTEFDLQLSEQALRILLMKLDDLFLYIEPGPTHLKTFSHKTRELLILACTEVENGWKYYLDKTKTKPLVGKNYTTRDYVQLVDKLHLKDYEFTLRSYSNLPPIRPFESWNSSKSTASLPWYQAYNLTKHDRGTNFSEATFWNCLQAVVAGMVVHCSRFSPDAMFNRDNTFCSIANQHFLCRLKDVNPTTFYLPEFSFPHAGWTPPYMLDPRLYSYGVPFKTLPFSI